MVRPNGSVMGWDSDAEALDAGPVIQYALLLRQPPWRTRRRTPPSQSMHDAMRIQSAPFLVQCKQSSGGGWRLRCRSGGIGRRGLGRFWLLRNQHFLLGGGLRRWASRLKFRDHRIGIDRRRWGRREISGDTNDLHRDGHRLELVQRVRDRETAVRGGYIDRAGCLATRPQRRPGIGALRHRLELNLHGWRRRLEGIPRERGAAGQAVARNCNRDDTTHDRSATLCGQPLQFPWRAYARHPHSEHRSVTTAVQPCPPG